MEEFYNKHYIRIREDGCIIDGFSDAFRQPSERDICISEQGGYQFCLFPGGEENPSLFDWNGIIPLYRWDAVTQTVVKRTEEEIEADQAAIPVPEPVPTTEQRVAALEEENSMLRAQISVQSDQMDFYEDCIAEMAMMVYA